ncbi:DUF5677 domain-containing protein [Desulfovibrio mangrovi]|uniref:DUF5677 domain-containing protein n=1 Tax=Desulfovibrio mangrovi TaxID=2976983 RepID=UPI0022462328|nr:DUF5677 domain-containing protein [Desulfovibrio mangrovi]UZP68725.1 DUF5677 domain-containing protein [Desulfovibrio mangrovi]
MTNGDLKTTTLNWAQHPIWDTISSATELPVFKNKTDLENTVNARIKITLKILEFIASTTEKNDNTLIAINKLECMITSGTIIRIISLINSSLELNKLNYDKYVTSILHRCAIESITRLQWIFTHTDKNSFDIYIEDGLNNIEKRFEYSKKNFYPDTQECDEYSRTMNKAIDVIYNSSGKKRNPVIKNRKMPKYNKILDEIGNSNSYILYQMFPSSSIHGSYDELLVTRYDKKEYEQPSNDTFTTYNILITDEVIRLIELFIEHILSDKTAHKLLSSNLDKFRQASRALITQLSHFHHAPPPYPLTPSNLFLSAPTAAACPCTTAL